MIKTLQQTSFLMAKFYFPAKTWYKQIIQHCTGGPSQTKDTRKIYKSHNNSKE